MSAWWGLSIYADRSGDILPEEFQQTESRTVLHSSSRSIAIIGAGLAGLTAALALLRAGWRVAVFEQAPVLGEVGAGISLSPGAGAGFASLGLAKDILDASLPIPDIAFLHYRSGALLAGVLDRGNPPDHGFQRPRHIHRADLHAILLAAVRRTDPNAVRTNKRLTSIAQADDAVTMSFTDASTATADLLIGADGARSAVRRACFDTTAPEFAGQVAFRCLIPRDLAEPFMGLGNAAVFTGPDRVFNRYLIRGGAIVNVVGIVRSSAWRDEGWNTPASTGEFLEAFEGFHPDVGGLISVSPPQTLIKWALYVRPPLKGWHRGRIVLIGDAAHPILPFLGLGAALAIEDAIVLPRALALTADHVGAFTAFEAARFVRVDMVRNQTLLQGELIQATDPDETGLGGSPSQDVDLFGYNPCEVPIMI
jgi:salicylate hydroxylase